MISPRSFMYYSGPVARSPPASAHAHSHSHAPAPSSSAASSPVTTPSSSSLIRTSATPSASHPRTPRSYSPSSSQQQPFQRPRQSFHPNSTSRTASTPSSHSPIAIRPAASVPRRITALKHEQRKPATIVTVEPISSPTTSLSTSPESDDIDTMGKRRDRTDSLGLSPPSPPSSTATLTRPSTPTSPVKIPKHNGAHPIAHPQKRHAGTRRRPKNVHSPEDISPSMAALLAMTDIPRHGQSQRRKKRVDKPLTVDDLFDGPQVSEKELSLSLSRSPMDLLLSPPEEVIDDDISLSDCTIGSALMTRTVSVDSMPSLGESFVTDNWSSVESPGTISPSLRGRRFSPMRKSLEPISSPPGEELEHPLSRQAELEDEVLNVLQTPAVETVSNRLDSFKPLKFAFKSNLTASLRALRSAAKSFSTINFTSIPSEDFLTRSLLNIDTRVPFADERRPPVTEDLPSAEMRRYLNPTTSSRIETPSATVPPPGTFSASIQMQTYKVHRSKFNTSSEVYPRASPQVTVPAEAPPSLDEKSLAPIPRQREMRENSDFIRIAVMEMAMRKRGKLDDQRPGRARWALPPRKTTSAPYVIGPNGVPARWRSISY